MQNLVLKIEEIDPYQFVNTQFPLNILLVDSTTNQPKLNDIYNLTMFASFEDPLSRQNYKEVPDMIEVIGNTNIKSNGLAETLLRFKEVSMSKQNKRFVIVASAYSKDNNTLIARGTSNPITCVKHKLIIQEESLVPYSWYKDEGGKDKCIELKALLVDSNKCLVRDRFVPLRALLTYSGGQPVQQQNILALSPDSRVCIDESGSARFKIRINEVSNRHRGQMFQVLISPDLSQMPATADISPALSVPVEVKSKRNASSKKTETIGSGNSTGLGLFNLQSSLFSPQNVGASGNLLMSGGAPSQSCSSQIGLDLSYAGAAYNPKRAKTTGGLFSDQPLMIGNAGAQSQQLLYSGINNDTSYSQLQTSNAAALSVALAESEELYEHSKAAFKSVVEWTQQVLTGVQKIQWIQVGFEVPPLPQQQPASPQQQQQQHAASSSASGGLAESKPPGLPVGGSFNFASCPAPIAASNVPMYNIVNPNEQIREIVARYKESTKESLGVMKDFLDRQPKLMQLQQTAQMQQLQQHQQQQQQSHSLSTSSSSSSSVAGMPFSLLQSNSMYGDYHNQPLTSYSLPSISSGLASSHYPNNLPSLSLLSFNPINSNNNNVSFDSVMHANKSFANPSGAHHSLMMNDDAINLLTFSSTSNAESDLSGVAASVSGEQHQVSASFAVSSDLPSLREEEKRVNLILARNVWFKGQSIGMPAFAASGDSDIPPEILGFYTTARNDVCAENKCSGGVTFSQLFFKTVNRVSYMKDNVFVQEVNVLLQSEAWSGTSQSDKNVTYSTSVFELGKHSNLIVMRERAMCCCMVNDLDALLSSIT